MSTKFITLTLLAGLVCLLSRTAGSAATIGPRCGSCFGASSLSENLATHLYSPAEYVHQVAVKISRNNLVSSSSVSNGTLQAGILSGIGCPGSSANLICAAGGAAVFDIPRKGTVSSTESIKANYDTADIIFSDITPRPEP